MWRGRMRQSVSAPPARSALERADEVVVVDAVGGGVGEEGAAGGFDRRDRLGDPGARRDAVRRAAAIEQAAARRRPIVDDEHAHARLRRRARRRQAAWARADDQNLAAPIARRGRGGGLPLRVDAAEAGHGADRRLEDFPARPEEGLVIEAGGHEAREDVEEGEDGRARRLGAALIDRAASATPCFKERRGCARVRLATAVAGEVDEGVGLLDPMSPDAARAVST